MTSDPRRSEAEVMRLEPDENALPAYSQDVPSQVLESNNTNQQLEEETSKLTLATADSSLIPDVSSCLSHLKLLRAFEILKQTIGYTDGLWDIWDSRAQGKVDVLSKLREKRWALYVARAVDRYESWWKSFVPDMLLERDMFKDEKDSRSISYEGFTKGHEPMRWTKDSLLPPDVLLVWHTHMLNPRIYLEDCLRVGFGSLWSAGLPWDVIDQSINGDFELTATQDCQLNWTERTGRPWINREDSMNKDILCPICSESKSVAWTTCGQAEYSLGKPGLVGQGYGDAGLSTVCKCGTVIDEELLRVAKFRADLKNLITKDWPMPGTIIDVKDGLTRPQARDSDQLFPNRLVRLGLAVELTHVFERGNSFTPTVDFIREKIEEITYRAKYRHSSDQLKRIDKGITGAATMASHVLARPARMQTRSMMSRYWTNSSPFGLDLKSAVMRQGVFSEKMFKINWLQSPTSKFTMEKLLKKYQRFFEIAAKHPGEFVTPTLDVDLAWHTHQLSPRQYFDYTTETTGMFTDHNDKVDEDKLAMSFDWMAKAYQEEYGEVYSECICWFCESLRFKHASSLSQRLSSKKVAVTAEPWRTTTQNLAEPPHISSHQSVHPLTDRNSARRTERHLFHNGVDEAFAKALKQSNQSVSSSGQKRNFSSIFKSSSSKSPNDGSTATTMGPRGNDKVFHWGKNIQLSGPWASSTHAAMTEQMYSAPPGAIHESMGKPGVCANGTCGGMTGCGSGAVALCGAGCVGMNKNVFGPGCVG